MEKLFENFGKNISNMVSFARSKARIKAMKNQELKDFSIGLLRTMYELERGGHTVAFDGIQKIKQKLQFIERDLDFLEETTKPEDWTKFKKNILEDKIKDILLRVENLRVGKNENDVFDVEEI